MRGPPWSARVVGSLFLIGASMLGTQPGVPGRSCGSAWGIVPTPDGGPLGNGFYGVDAVATDDVWAVGYYHDQVGQKTLAFHWDGIAWSITPTPDIGLESALTAVDAVASDDVWAVGFAIPQGGGGTVSLIEHWDGARWTVFSTPPVEGLDASLSSVSAWSAEDAWAVGSSSNGLDDSRTLTELGRCLVVVEFWNGVKWSPVETPRRNRITLHAAATLAWGDTWAVGARIDESGSVVHTVAEHRCPL